MRIQMIVKPAGHRILINPKLLEEKTKGGIIIPIDQVKKEQMAVVEGIVLDIGPTAYADQDVPWCKIGDKVLYQKYVGMRVPNEDGTFRDDLLLINDLDVCAVVQED
jgi:co-chaperonin GroES (HSP10)